MYGGLTGTHQPSFKRYHPRPPTASSCVGIAREHSNFWVPLLTQKQVKLQTFNLAGTFIGCIQTKAHKKFLTRGIMGISRDCPNFLEYPILSQDWVKLRTLNFVRTFIGSIRTKAHEKFWEK